MFRTITCVSVAMTMTGDELTDRLYCSAKLFDIYLFGHLRCLNTTVKMQGGSTWRFVDRVQRHVYAFDGGRTNQVFCYIPCLKFVYVINTSVLSCVWVFARKCVPSVLHYFHLRRALSPPVHGRSILRRKWMASVKSEVCLKCTYALFIQFSIFVLTRELLLMMRMKNDCRGRWHLVRPGRIHYQWQAIVWRTYSFCHQRNIWCFSMTPQQWAK